MVSNSESEAVDLLLQTYREPAIMLHRPYPPLNLPPGRSRLGGLPLLPETFDWPVGRTWHRPGEKGTPVALHFLAQIDCAELPSVDPRMPTEGMLFFFGRDDGEQDWSNEQPQDDARVIYAPRVAADQRERPAPPDLQPIGGDYLYFDKLGLSRRVGPWLLPEETTPSVHASWPVVPLRINSWPDFSAIFDTPLCRKLVRRISGAAHPHEHPKIIELLKNGISAPYDDALSKWQAALDRLGELYDRRVESTRAAAVVVATGLATPAREERSPRWGANLVEPFRWPTDGRADNPKPFPQAGIMIDRIARSVVRYVLGLVGYQSWQEPAKQQALKDIEAAGRRWVARAAEIGWDKVPPQADVAGFMAWLQELAQDAPSVHMRYSLRDIFTKAFLSSVTYAAGSPRAAALIPPDIYDDLEREHLPFRWKTDGKGGWRLKARHHQMRGHAPSCQEAERYSSASIMLLQLESDYRVNMTFGDLGAVSFRIKPDDLVARRFEKAWGEIVGH